MKLTKTFRVSRLTKGAHISFHADMLELIDRTDLTAIDLAEPLARYRTLVEAMAGNVVRNTGFVATAWLKDYDRERDLLLSAINAVVYAYHYSPLAERAEPYHALRTVMKDFKGIRYSGYSEQTAQVCALIERLAEPELAAHVAALGLTPEVEALKRANDNFSAEFNRKCSEAAVRIQANNAVSPTTRSEADKLYYDIVAIISAHALIRPTEVLDEFIRYHNGIIETYRSIEQNTGK